MKLVFRVLSLLIAAMLLLTGLQWIVDPRAAASSLGMELLTGVGASTQIGDISAFFLVTSAMIVMAQRSGQAHWYAPPAMLVGVAAITRSLAWMTGNADLAAEFIVPELVIAGVLAVAARTRSGEGEAKAAAAS